MPVADWIAARGLRLARECLAARGIEIVGERYVPLGAATSRDWAQING